MGTRQGLLPEVEFQAIPSYPSVFNNIILGLIASALAPLHSVDLVKDLFRSPFTIAVQQFAM